MAILIKHDGTIEPFNLKLLRQSRWSLMAQSRHRSEEADEYDGEVDFGAEFQSHDIELHCVTDDGLTVEQKYQKKVEISDALNKFRNGDWLMLESNPGKKIFAHFTGRVQMEEYPSWLRVNIPLKLDPFWVSVEENEFTGISGTIENNGTYETPTIIEVLADSGSVKNPSIIIGEEEIKYNGVINEKGLLKIDTDKMTVVSNVGEVLSFDGVDDKVNIGNYPAGTNPFTIELWLKPKAADDGMFLSNGLGSHHNRLFLRINNDKTISFYTNDASGATTLASNFTVTLDEWVHLAVTRSGTAGKIIIDGVEDVSGTVRGGNLDGGRDWYIGARSDTTFPHECSIRDLRIWNIARTEEDIANDMNKKLTGNEPGLVHYWPMDEGSGNTIYDQTGDNDGTISGAIWVLDNWKYEGGFPKLPPGNTDVSVTADIGTPTVTFKWHDRWV